MNPKTTLEVIAPTVEEALAQGLEQLGLTADAVSFEVLDTGSKGLFGLGKQQVRVRLTVNGPEGEEESVETGSTTFESEPVPAPSQEEPAPVQEASSRMGQDPLLDLTESVISKLIHMMGLEAQVSAHYGDSDREDRRYINVDVRGNDLSVLIGRRSETLNAFQYVASLMIGKEAKQFVHLMVDVEGYRARREKQLIKMAERMADQVASNGRKQTLEPMTSAERRIIHIALRGHPAIYTESTGEDPYRKVMILPKEE
ncbi:MAG TPA: RNA-binding cell elongation regulator Jag/EloR [Anaerolineales bacterium]|nr:RNA-binding cell elongation regulator Jag/EloR [Anaerolineales bacterium]